MFFENRCKKIISTGMNPRPVRNRFIKKKSQQNQANPVYLFQLNMNDSLFFYSSVSIVYNIEQL